MGVCFDKALEVRKALKYILVLALSGEAWALPVFECAISCGVACAPLFISIFNIAYGGNIR